MTTGNMKTNRVSIPFSIFITAVAFSMTMPVFAEENDRYARLVLFVSEDAGTPENHEARRLRLR
jgi:heme/copper-type cytochrome/quinol oxidase subunit 4